MTCLLILHEPLASVPPDQVAMGVGVAAMCAVGLWKERWLLTESRRLQQLKARCGDEAARWLFRGTLVAGMAFGSALATGWINPLFSGGPPPQAASQ